MTSIASRRAASALLTDAGWIVAGSAILATSAQIAWALPFSPVPVTLQTFGLALIVGLLGTRLATLATLAYLAEGAGGLPVFAQHQAGFVWLLGPSAGYLWAFVPAAFVMGRALDLGLWRHPLGRFLAVALGTSVVFTGGALWLSRFVGIGPALAVGVTPFLAADGLKSAIAALVAPVARRFGPTR